MKDHFLQTAFDSYFEDACKYAKYRFDKNLKAYFQKRGITLVTGNGTYYLEDSKGYQVDVKSLPKKIREVLTIEVPGYGYELGSLMPYFFPEK